jgi:ribosomal protein S18 acetylase RimI-like enzyme
MTPSTAPPLAVELRPLAWDTDFFGARMGVIARRDQQEGGATAANLEEDLAETVARAGAEGYAHVIFRAGAEDNAAIWAAQRAGMRLVDVGVDSTVDLARVDAPAPAAGAELRAVAVGLRPAGPGDLPALQDLGAGSFTLSRVSADPFFTPQQVQAFHRQWVANLVGGLAAAVLVREVEGRVAGFVSCSRSGDEGRIPLIATDAAFRRRGVGQSLVAGALRWFAQDGARLALVKTQAHNYPALALYQQAGFRITRTELTFSAAPGGLSRP